MQQTGRAAGGSPPPASTCERWGGVGGGGLFQQTSGPHPNPPHVARRRAPGKGAGPARGKDVPKTSSAGKTIRVASCWNASDVAPCWNTSSIASYWKTHYSSMITPHGVRQTGIETVALRLLTSITVMSSPKPFATYMVRSSRESVTPQERL